VWAALVLAVIAILVGLYAWIDTKRDIKTAVKKIMRVIRAELRVQEHPQRTGENATSLNERKIALAERKQAWKELEGVGRAFKAFLK